MCFALLLLLLLLCRRLQLLIGSLSLLQDVSGCMGELVWLDDRRVDGGLSRALRDHIVGARHRGSRGGEACGLWACKSQRTSNV